MAFQNGSFVYTVYDLLNDLTILFICLLATLSTQINGWYVLMTYTSILRTITQLQFTMLCMFY